MYTPDEKTEELLSGYLDGCLSAIELEQIESALVADESLRDYFQSMQLLQTQFRSELRTEMSSSVQNASSKLSGNERFDSILAEAKRRAESDPLYANATWVLGSDSGSRNVIREEAESKKSGHRLVWAMMAVAASLLLVCGWWLQSRFGQELQPQQGLIATIERPSQSDDSLKVNEATSAVIANSNNEKLKEIDDKGVSGSDSLLKSLNNNSISSDSSIAKLDAVTKLESMNGTESPSSNGSERIANANVAVPKPQPGNSMNILSESTAKPGSDFVKPFVPPSPAEIAAMENAIKGAKKLTYLLVIDLSLRDSEASREALDNILVRYDIPSAVDMNVEESTLKKLEESRMIASGKVALPNLKPVGPKQLGPKQLEADKNSSVASDSNSGEDTAGLIFVKARGERLDAAIIEMIQNIDEFPEFSLDMAFDAPAQALAAELQNVQEASLPRNAPIARSSVASRLLMRDEAGKSVDRFLAPSRRGLPLPREKRESGKGPNGMTAEMMNPVSNALIILRNPM